MLDWHGSGQRLIGGGNNIVTLRSARSLRQRGFRSFESCARPIVGICCDESSSGQSPLVAAFKNGFCGHFFQDVELAQFNLPAAGVWLVDTEANYSGFDLLVVAGSHNAAAVGGTILPPIPVVFIASHVDRLGLVESIGRPGRQATGVDLLGKQIVSRRIEHLVSLVPDATTVHFLYDPRFDDAARLEAEAQAVGRHGIAHSVAGPGDAEAVLAAFKFRGRAVLDIPASVMRCLDPVLNEGSSERHLIPTSFERTDCARAGGLMSYGPALSSAYRQAGVLAARVLAGEAPGAIPVQQAHDFVLSLNEAVAQRLGLQIPTHLKAQASEVIV